MLVPPERFDSKPLDSIDPSVLKKVKETHTVNDLIPEENTEIKRHVSKEEKRKKFEDKVTFFINAMTLNVSIYFFLVHPSYYPYLSSLVLTLQIIHRAHEYYTLKWHYYMLDFCYVVNVMTILYPFYPENDRLFISAFALSVGPILFSTFVYKFPLAFHSTIKFTSCWTHFSPGLSMWIVRWMDKDNFYNRELFFSNIKMDFYFFLEYTCLLLFIYFAWAIPYYYINFIWRYNYILENGLENNFIYAFRKPGMYGTKKRVLWWGEKWAPLCFMFMHFRYVFGCCFISFFLLFSYKFSLFTMLFMFASITWNAGTFYIDQFSENYLSQFKSIKDNNSRDKRDSTNSSDNQSVKS